MGRVRWLILLCAVLALTFPRVTLARPGPEPRVDVAPAPAWVDTSWEETVLDVEPAGGVAALGFETQLRHVGARRVQFFRTVFRVDSESGVRESGQRTFEFTPPHERLIVHRLEVRRGERATFNVRKSDIRILHRETRMDDSIYDGARTAVVVLPNLRVGDVIVTEYSVEGTNPILNGHLAHSWTQRLFVPVGVIRYRIVADRSLYHRSFGGAEPPREETNHGLTEYSWKGQGLAPVKYEDAIPSDHDPLPRVQFSDMASWAEVVEWARSIFESPRTLGEGLESRVAEIESETEMPEERLRSVLRLVQDEVRYLSLAFAESTHRPAPPSEVLARGYGDCKDKTLLAVTLLQALGLEAAPALVHSSRGRHLADALPTIHAFDHVIVAVDVDGTRWFVDPTLLYQRGTIEYLAATGFHHALVLSEGTDNLLPVPERDGVRISSTVKYTLADFGGPVSIESRTTYMGHWASQYRGLHASQSQEEFSKAAAGPILAVHPDAERIGPAAFLDWEERNEVLVVQRFRLSNPWRNAGNDSRSFSLEPARFRGALTAAAPDRVHPIAVEHPLRIVQHTVLEIPEPVVAKAESEEVHDPTFRFSYRAEESSGKTVQLRHELSTLAATVEPEALEAYRDSLRRFASSLEYTVSKGRSAPAPRGPDWIVVAALALWMALVGLGIWFVQTRQPYLERPEVPYVPELAGRSGWLLLVALNVTTAPLRIFATLAENWSVYLGSNSTLWNAGSPLYEGLAGLVTFELFGNVGFFVVAIYAAYLFWSTRRSFPIVFIVMHVGFPVFALIDHLASSSVPGLVERSGEGIGGTLGLLFAGALWSGYALQSKRVKATFLPPPRGDDATLEEDDCVESNPPDSEPATESTR